jgi:hypothetical protein
MLKMNDLDFTNEDVDTTVFHLGELLMESKYGKEKIFYEYRLKNGDVVYEDASGGCWQKS